MHPSVWSIDGGPGTYPQLLVRLLRNRRSLTVGVSGSRDIHRTDTPQQMSGGRVHRAQQDSFFRENAASSQRIPVRFRDRCL